VWLLLDLRRRSGTKGDEVEDFRLAGKEDWMCCWGGVGAARGAIYKVRRVLCVWGRGTLSAGVA
jgi:hypothetical protein